MMSKQNFNKIYAGVVVGVVAAAALGAGLAELTEDDDASVSKVEDPNVECMLDDTSTDCTDLYSRAVAESGRFDDARFFIHGGGYSAMRDNEETLAVIESNGLIQCFAVVADSTDSVSDPVDVLNADDYRPNFTGEDVPNHLAVVYDDAARSRFTFGAEPSEVTAFIFAKDEEACRSFPNDWDVDGLIYNNM